MYMMYIHDENGAVNGIGLWYPGNTEWTYYYFVKNLQGDVLEIYGENHNCVASYTYDSWGNILSKSGSLADINPFRYRGYYFDNESWFYYLQSRYYDPAIGRFINADDTGYLGVGSDLTSYNLFTYCGNNPVMGYDPTGHWDWKDQVAIGATITMIGFALLLAPPTGGASLGALAISASKITAIGGAAVFTGTAVVGDAIAASISEANGKPTSRNQMQKQVESGKAPNEVDRVDPSHNDVDNSQNHIHFKDGTAINQDGSLSHKGNGIPNITRAILKWILDNGWSAPKF